uniref:Single domain-containing protein n=1 Tax=Daphnia galeata TaxID=27404 RepID=A0A8J2S0H8_9CRUS|nr:unnamed protein product [Daphnia galeata]
MARSLIPTIKLSMLVILAFGCFSVTLSAPTEEGQLQFENVGNENLLDTPETRLTETETVDVRGKDARCFWSGTAPFCQGYCPSKVYVTKASDRCGDGKCCMTGMKKYCCPK